MSAPPSQRRPTPLHERSPSQNNALAIRIVPYSPPRLQPDGPNSSRQSSHTYAAGGSLAGSGNQPSSGENSSRTRGFNESHASSPGSALSASSSSSLPLAGQQGAGVSALKLVTGTLAESSKSPISPPGRQPWEPDSTQTQHHGQTATPNKPSTTGAGGAPLRPLSRRRNFVAVHSDKTFSLVRRDTPSESSRSLVSPQPSYSSRASSPHEQPSIDAWSEERLSSPFTGTNTTVPDRSFSPYSNPSAGSSATELAEDPDKSLPRDHRMIGGLRKVPGTPDLKVQTAHYSLPPASETLLAPLPEISASQEELVSLSRSLVPKASFASTDTASTTSETTNYKVYGHSPAQVSSDSLDPPISIHTNYEILGQSSPAVPFASSSPARSLDSDENYILHGDPSPSSLVSLPRKPRQTYSQESLIVPPLRPFRQRSNERLGYYKQRSRENIRARAGSIKSIKSIKSISSFLTQEAAHAFLAAPLLVNLQGSSTSHITPREVSSVEQGAQDSWEALQPFPGSSTTRRSRSATTNIATPQRLPMIESHPHQWSSQLSTVLSESEAESEAAHSRSVSYASTGTGNVQGQGHMRRSSAGWASSMHSRQLPSISSSLAGAQLEEVSSVEDTSASASRSESLERPQRTYSRTGNWGSRTVRDQDEHGDGLADLQQMAQRPSRLALSTFFNHSDSSGRNLHSSASSRANSFNSATIPAWAKVYYGSGERRFLAAPSISTTDAADSRPSSSAFHISGSPSAEHFPLSIYSPRRRANHVNPPTGQRPFSNSGSMDITGVPPTEDYGVFRSLRKKTSSIWSPHLRVDRRASRYSIWEPPSVTWSADSGLLGKRNAQVLLFTVGFVFPFAWMIAAFLPLPENAKQQMLEREHDQSQFGAVDSLHQVQLFDEARYESARWWRTVNRFMSIVGLLIIGAVAALVVIGLRRWTIHS
ncbi:hypothetical protein VTK73DRAFT_1981 [Phialemonium thermophilum]|uniref:Serine-rich protein n=1 Tax=Phialemonium thermophilum TaxID=223376 RepID=A0ABR3X6N7_9PEZI